MNLDSSTYTVKQKSKTLTLVLVILFVIHNITSVFAQEQKAVQKSEQKPIVYLIPGQGADYRLFKNIEIDSTFDKQHINYITPDEDWDMNDFAHVLAQQIDTTRTFYLVGVSLGGMLATEMGSFLHPEKIILISSAKQRKELPGGYRFQKTIPFYKLVSGKLSKKGALFFQPIFEPDRKVDPETFDAMLKAKDPDFLKRTIAMIIEWNNTVYSDKIIHIHGDNDNTIPVRNIECDYLIKDGSHMMVLTRGEEISNLINKILLSS